VQVSESGIWWGFESLPTHPHGVAVGDCLGAGRCPGRNSARWHPRRWRSFDDVEIGQFRWVEWFNEQRLQGELGEATRAEIETAGPPITVDTVRSTRP